MNKLEECVRDFHKQYRCAIGDTRNPGFKNHALRKNLVLEECNELAEAIEWGRFDEAIRECFDILYVTAGTLIAFGITDFDKYITELHRANMNKVGGSTREDGKILKPKGWEPPRISELIEDQRVGTKPEQVDYVPLSAEEIEDAMNNTETTITERKNRGRPKRSN